MDTITVIIPVYNTAKYLEDCLDSVFNQTYHKLEVIIVNDGSTDKSSEIIIKYAEKYSNMIYIDQENQGLSMARNAGLKLATGEFISFLDSDDIIESHMFEILMKVLKKNKAEIAYTSFKRFKKKPIKYLRGNRLLFKKKVCNSKEALTFYFKSKAGNVWGGLFKRDLFKGISFPPGLIYEDNLPKAQLLYKSKCTVFIDADLYYYRNTRNSITTQKFSEKKYDIVIIGYMIENYLKKQDAINFKIYKNDYYILIIEMLYEALKESIREKKYNYDRFQSKVPFQYLNKILLLGVVYDIRKYGIIFKQVYLRILYSYITK